MIGRFLNEEYEGGCEEDDWCPWPYEVEGLLSLPDALRLEDEGRSRGSGELRRDRFARDCSKSFRLFSLNRLSN